MFWIITAVANWYSTKELVAVNYGYCGWTLVNGTFGYSGVLPDLSLSEWRSCSRRSQAMNSGGTPVCWAHDAERVLSADLSDLGLIRKQEMKGS